MNRFRLLALLCCLLPLGLAHALQVLSRVEGIGHIVFRESDVVRHDLVRRIVDAYGVAERGSLKSPERP